MHMHVTAGEAGFCPGCSGHSLNVELHRTRIQSRLPRVQQCFPFAEIVPSHKASFNDVD